MMTDLLQKLTTRDSLLAIGVSLVVFGFLLRLAARNSRRDAALRQQHRLHDHKLDEALQAEQSDETVGWFERNVSILAPVATYTGLAITVLSFFRK